MIKYFLTIYITPFSLGEWFQFVCNYKDKHVLISKDTS